MARLVCGPFARVPPRPERNRLCRGSQRGDRISLGGGPQRSSGHLMTNQFGRQRRGVVTLNVEVGAKRLELLHEMVPTATIVALLVNPTNPTLAEALTRDLQAAAPALWLNLHVLHASSEREFDTAFASLVQLRAGALVIGADALFNSLSEQLAALTVRHAVPAIYQFREFTAAGGLMSYGSTVADTYR